MNPNKKDDSFIYLLKRLINKLQKKRKIQFVFLLIITSCRGVILKLYIIIVLVLCPVNKDDCLF